MKNSEVGIIGKFQSRSISSRLPYATLAIALAGIGLLASPKSAQAAGPCQTSAKQAHVACSFDVRDDFWESKATCSQLSDAEERADCLDEAAETRAEEWEECRERLAARLEFCALSDEEYYDPPFEPGMFTDSFMNNNPYWPLQVGNYWEFEGEEEVVVVNVLDATKRIDGVDCIVVNDVVSDEDGKVIEDTDDWYVHALNGDVYYCGENSRDFEFFEGDDPEVAELVAIDGSFKQGVDGAKAGVVMWANPQVGDMYRQEFSIANAEDVAEVLSTTFSYGDGSGLDEGVPQELVELFCDGDCVVIREWNLTEPGPEALKYYSPGVGVFLELEDGEVVELVACNVDSRCDEL